MSEGWKKVDRVDTQSAQTTMAAYVAAVDKFSRSSTEFMQHVSLLVQARHAYQQAQTASEELRNFLDAIDETLRILMAQLEQERAHLSMPVLDKKKPEPVNVEAIKARSESTGGAKKLF